MKVTTSAGLSCGNRNHFFAAQTMSLGSVPATTGGKTGDLVAEVETSVDYAETAQLANDAFAEHGAFSAEHLRWLYERSFSEGSTVVSLRANGRKVGQFAMVRQKVVTGGVVEPARPVGRSLRPQVVPLAPSAFLSLRRSRSAMHGARHTLRNWHAQCQRDRRERPLFWTQAAPLAGYPRRHCNARAPFAVGDHQ